MEQDFEDSNSIVKCITLRVKLLTLRHYFVRHIAVDVNRREEKLRAGNSKLKAVRVLPKRLSSLCRIFWSREHMYLRIIEVQDSS